MKHIPFESIYRERFEVVEERQGQVSLYPHTDQLPLLLRALNLEFLGGLPDRYARVDARASGLDKLVRWHSALMFCTFINRARKDQLRLFHLPDPDLVGQVTIVQQISEDTPRGRTHRFRFYGRDGFFPEIRLSGKRVVFADHVLQRFSSRVPEPVGSDLTRLLITFFSDAVVSFPVGQGRAFVVHCRSSIVAFTYTERAEEFFITTCLTINEMNTLVPEPYPHTCNFHYSDTFTKPRLRTWIPVQRTLDVYQLWERKAPFQPLPQVNNAALNRKMKNWRWVAGTLWDFVGHEGYGFGSQLCFTDLIPGPCVTEIKPGGKIPEVDELKIYREINPQIDWDALVAEREAAEARMRQREPPCPITSAA